jgi:hypothetical protein
MEPDAAPATGFDGETETRQLITGQIMAAGVWP